MDAPSFMQGLVSAIQTGGLWMAPIAIALTLSVAFALERFFALRGLYVDGHSFMYEVEKHVMTDDVDGAIKICDADSRAALPKVIKAGLQRASRSTEQIQNAIDSTSLKLIPKLERRLPYLALIANIATLLGLLGTITGLIHSFNAVAMADPAQRQAILSKGIAEAMNSTAFGLITAIFTMIAHSVLSNKAAGILDEMDAYGVKLIDLLSTQKYRAGGEKAVRE